MIVLSHLGRLDRGSGQILVGSSLETLLDGLVTCPQCPVRKIRDNGIYIDHSCCLMLDARCLYVRRDPLCYRTSAN